MNKITREKVGIRISALLRLEKHIAACECRFFASAKQLASETFLNLASLLCQWWARVQPTSVCKVIRRDRGMMELVCDYISFGCWCVPLARAQTCSNSSTAAEPSLAESRMLEQLLDKTPNQQSAGSVQDLCVALVIQRRSNNRSCVPRCVVWFEFLETMRCI